MRGAATLAESLNQHRTELELYRTLATLRTDVPMDESVGDLEWRGARRDELETLSRELGRPNLVERVPRWRE